MARSSLKEMDRIFLAIIAGSVIALVAAFALIGIREGLVHRDGRFAILLRQQPVTPQMRGRAAEQHDAGHNN